MAKTLLEKAKEVSSHNNNITNIGEEEKELALAYLRGEINSKQIRVAMNKEGIQFYSFIVRAVRELIKEGKIILK